MNRLIAFTAVALLISGCREAVDDAPENAAESQAASQAASNAATPPDAEGNVAMTSAAQPLGAPVSGDEAKRLMNVRHDGMEEIGDAMKLVSAQLKGDTPDLTRVREGAGTMARLAPEALGWYRPGTGPDVGKTRAKAEIWQKPDDFAAKMRTFEQAAQAFNAAAQRDDVAAIKVAHANLGKSCKACHDPYRAEEH